MIEPWSGWMRFRYPMGYFPPEDLIIYARQCMGDLLDYLTPLNLRVGRREFHYEDGTILEVSFDGTTPTATLWPGPESVNAQKYPPANLWLPRGFVIYPAWSDAPFGVGLPIIADSSVGPYDPTNTAPGMDRTRWTVGGPCGEVLLSPDKNAAYPLSPLFVTVPLLFHPQLGPVLQWQGDGMMDMRDPDGTWSPYRLEHEPPVQHYADESVPDMQALFEAVNAYRQTNGAHVLQLPIRGYEHPGQVMSSIMLTAGSTDPTNPNYPSTYDTPANRLAKEGYAALRLGQSFTSWTRSDNLLGVELRAAGSVSGAMAQWEADTTDQPALIADYGPSGTCDAGVRGGFVCASLLDRDRWIEAGNQCWYPGDSDLPILSWMGFASLNLAWETFPASYDPTSSSEPIVPANVFTLTNGDCWLTYPRSTSPTPSDYEPAMSRHLFCRGRAIAQSPRGGLVWGACTQVVDGVTDPSDSSQTITVDRLIALVHHPEDQPTDLTQGMTRYLRVWWCDLPRRGQLRADPQEPIVGEDSSDPWGWKGGDRIDLGNMSAPSSGFTATGSPNSLKYASQWRFAPDGSRAICLRDYGAQADYAVSVIGNKATLETNNARPVELFFTCTPTDVLTSVTYHDYPGGQTQTPKLLADGKPPLTGDILQIGGVVPAPLYDLGAYPLAVDYSANGGLLYAYSVTLLSSWVAMDTGTAEHLAYAYVGQGSASAAFLSDLTYPSFMGVNFKTPNQNFEPVLQSVLDVRQGAYLGMGYLPRFQVDTANLTTMNGPAGGFSGPVAPSTPTNPPCNLFTTDLVDGVRLWRQGTQLEERWFPNPDGCLWQVAARCHKSTDPEQVSLTHAISHSVQGFHVERFGQFLLSYQVSPMPAAVLVADSNPSDSSCGCQLTVTELAGSVTFHWMRANELNPRGGAAHASVTLPSSDWLIYAKVL